VSARTRVVALVVVAALVALSAATLLGILLSGGSGGSGGSSDPESLGGGPQPSAPAGAEPELTLVLPARTPGRCAAFSVDVLSGAEQAFSGTAVTVDDREAVLQVDHWYRGGDADLVRLATGDLAARGLVEGLGLTEGERYLVSADAGVVTPCGYSAPWSPAMARAYAQAFEG
jgi:hypothetical protein